MDYAALRAELDGPRYAALSDAEAAAALNAPAIDTVVAIETADVREILLSSSEWGALKLVARRQPTGDATADALIAVAITAVDAVELTTTMRTDKPATLATLGQMVAALVAAGVVKQETADLILALPHRKISRAEHIGLGPVEPGEVYFARERFGKD